jgi:hypothetical protein
LQLISVFDRPWDRSLGAKMEWLVESWADLTTWQAERGLLSLELIAGEEELPTGETPVVVMRLLGAQVTDTLEADLKELVADGVWGVQKESRSDRIVVIIEGEGYSVEVPCDSVEVLHRPLERRHYERVIARHKDAAHLDHQEIQRLRAQVHRVEVFLKEQVNRAERIASGVGESHPDARLRAEARLRLATEVANILRGEV